MQNRKDAVFSWRLNCDKLVHAAKSTNGESSQHIAALPGDVRVVQLLVVCKAFDSANPHDFFSERPAPRRPRRWRRGRQVPHTLLRNSRLLALPRDDHPHDSPPDPPLRRDPIARIDAPVTLSQEFNNPSLLNYAARLYKVT